VVVLVLVLLVEIRRPSIQSPPLHLSSSSASVTITRTTARTILLRNRDGVDIPSALH
jgi:hypothetical protein